MIGLIIFAIVYAAIFLYLWALTQQQCNDNTAKTNKEFEAIKDALQAMERYCDTLEKRIKILENRKD